LKYHFLGRREKEARKQLTIERKRERERERERGREKETLFVALQALI